MNNLLIGISKANGALLQEDNIDEALNKTVAELGSATGVDRCYIFTNKVVDGELRLCYSYEWCNTGVEAYLGNPALADGSYQDFPGLYDTFIKGEALYGLVQDNPNRYFVEMMEMQGIKAFLFTPIFCDAGFWGWMGYDDCTKFHKWTPEEVEALHSVARNIGLRLSREKAKQEFNNAQERFNLTVEASQQGVWEWITGTEQCVFSERFMSMIGYEHYEFEHTYSNWRKHLHPDDVEPVERSLKTYLENATTVYQTEYRLRHKDGHYLWLKVSGIAKRDQEGNPVYMVGSLLDISLLRSQQQKLEQQRNEIASLINNIDEVVFLLDKQLCFQYLNANWQKLTGNPAELALGKPILEFLERDENNCFNVFVENAQNSTTSATGEFRIKDANGDFVWCVVTLRNYMDGDSGEKGLVGSIVNIHQKKLIELRERELTEMKSGFIAMASHQFRTPLTVIFSSSELIELLIQQAPSAKSAQVADCTNKIRKEITRMTELIDNILLVGRYDSSQLAANLRPHDLKTFLEETVHSMPPHADGRRLRMVMPEEVPQVVIDELLFTHVMTNIISNAFKYSPGKPEPIIELLVQENEVLIRLTDFGIGIPKDELEAVFQSFYRASNTSTFKGSGLGLIIVREFMELHNGSVTIESELGIGTTVTLHLPMAPEHQPEIPTHEPVA